MWPSINKKKSCNLLVFLEINLWDLKYPIVEELPFVFKRLMMMCFSSACWLPAGKHKLEHLWWFDAFRMQQTALLWRCLHVQPWISSSLNFTTIMALLWWPLACFICVSVCCLKKPIVQCHSRLLEFLLLGDVLTNSFLLSKTSLLVSAVITSLILFLKWCILL